MHSVHQDSRISRADRRFNSGGRTGGDPQEIRQQDPQVPEGLPHRHSLPLATNVDRNFNDLTLVGASSAWMESTTTDLVRSQLRDTTELMEIIVRNLDKPALAALTQVDRSLFTRAIKHLYHHLNHIIPTPILHFLPLMPPEVNRQLLQQMPMPVLRYVSRYVEYTSQVKSIDLDLGPHNYRPAVIPSELNYTLFHNFKNLQTVRVKGWSVAGAVRLGETTPSRDLYLWWHLVAPPADMWDIVIERLTPGQPQVVIKYSMRPEGRVSLRIPGSMPSNHAAWFARNFPGAEYRLVAVELEDSDHHESHLCQIDRPMPYLEHLEIYITEHPYLDPHFPNVLRHLPNLCVLIYQSILTEQHLRTIARHCVKLRELAIIVDGMDWLDHDASLDSFLALELLSADRLLPEMKSFTWVWNWKVPVDWSALLDIPSSPARIPWGAPGSAFPHLRSITFGVGPDSVEPVIANVLAICVKLIHRDVDIKWSLKHLVNGHTDLDDDDPQHMPDTATYRARELERWRGWVETFDAEYARWQQELVDRERESEMERELERATQPVGWRQLDRDEGEDEEGRSG